MATTKKPSLKIGRPVEFTRRNGQKARGRINAVSDMANGRWVAVNTAEPRKSPVISRVRESELRFV